MTPLEATTAGALFALDRRAVLRLAGVAALALVAPAGCGDAPAAFTPPADARLRVLSPRGFATLTAAACRLAGPEVAAAVARAEIAPGLVADEWLDRAPVLAGPATQALAVLDVVAPTLAGRPGRFATLDGAAQDAVLADLAGSRMALKRALHAGVRSLGLLAVYLPISSRRFTGYPGPFGDDRVTIGDAMAPLPLHPASRSR